MTKIDFDSLNRELEESAARRTPQVSIPFSFNYFFTTLFFPKQLVTLLKDAGNYTDIDYYFELEAKGIKLLVKRIIRKLGHFLFFKTFETQRMYNTSLLWAENLLYKSLKEMQEQSKHDKEVIRSLEARLSKLEAKNGQ